MAERKIYIIGGGPAGMMAAIKAAEVLRESGDERAGDRIVLYDKNDVLGRKIYLTGRGRCNITNMRPWSEFSTHIHPNQNFLKHAFHAFSNSDVIAFFESLGVPTVVLQGQRVFPASLKAADVARSLENRVHELGIQVRRESVDIKGFDRMFGDGIVILATGGKSYPVTGSTGDGYEMASSVGHTVTSLFPCETALLPYGYDRNLEGIELKNVSLSLFVDKDKVQVEEGDFSFTNDGIESGIAYKISRRAVWALMNGQRVEVVLDLKPALSKEKLAARIARDVVQMKGRPKASSLLRGLMPEALIAPFLMADKRAIEIESLPDALKSWRMKIESFKGYERAVVTAGGVSLKEVSQKTMASKMKPGLFLAGEVLDLDGDTGGYNLQIAFSTGALAGSSAAKELLTSSQAI
ncbi:MAG: NAD(P)/FAD-dependent oxidoreductase [Bacteroidales bacterium]|nr:NAD(P)/FAD-dependent oxidoreductase [Candidatus Cacconaster merdequi]